MVLTVCMVIGIIAGWFANRMWLDSLSGLFYNFALMTFTCFLMWVINVAQECRWDMLNAAVGVIDSVSEQVWDQLRAQSAATSLLTSAAKAKLE